MTTTGVWIVYFILISVLTTTVHMHPFTILILPVIFSGVITGPHIGLLIGTASVFVNFCFIRLIGLNPTYSVPFLIGHTVVMACSGVLVGALHKTINRLRIELGNREETEKILLWKEKENTELAMHKTQLLEGMYKAILEHYAFLNSVISLTKETHSGNEETLKVLNDMQSRISALAETRRFIFDSSSEHISLEKLIILVANTIIYEFSGSELVSINTDICPGEISTEAASNLALVLNELLINTIQFAMNQDAPITIDIKCSRLSEAEIEFVYMDSGPGFPAAVLNSGRTGTGMMLIDEIVNHSLGGELQIVNSNGALVRFLLDSVRKIT